MSKISADHISMVIDFLNEHACYAVLRNYEGLPDNNQSRDIDIIIPRSDYNRIKRQLVQLIDRSGWKILTYLNSDRLITYVCVCQYSAETELVQWDFFMNTSVFGIVLMDAEEFLARRKFNGFLYHVDTECQFLDKYLYNRAVGSTYPEKYKVTREKAEFSPFVENKLRTLYGVPSVAACDKTGSSKLLMSAISVNMRHPWRLICSVGRFLKAFAGNYLCSNTGFSIGFTGPDGSGKTTVINMLIEQLGDVFRKAHVYFHFRPMLFGNLSDVAHSAGLKKEVDREYDKPHRGSNTGVLSSLIRLMYYSADYLFGYFLRVKPVIRITRIAIFDRYYTDIICDSRRSRIYLNPKFLYRFGKLFIPALDYNILLTASIDTILARKQELDKQGIQDINDKINYLSDKKGYYRILNEATPEDAVHEILGIVFENQHKKNMKRLCRN